MYMCESMRRVAVAGVVKHIDEHFIWDHHIEHGKKKVSRGVYAINMSKHLLSQIHLKTLYM